MAAFFHGLRRRAFSVASNVCWAIHNLAQALPFEPNATTNAMSPYFQQLMERLLKATARPDADKHNLLSSAYEAINALISSAAKDTWPVVAQLIPVFIQQLESTLVSTALSATDREKQNEVQALLCGAMQTIIQRLDEATVLTYADHVHDAVHQGAGQQERPPCTRSRLMAIGALANRMGQQFDKYMQALQAVPATKGLQNEREYKVCQVAVGLVGDLARALENKFMPLSERLRVGHSAAAPVEQPPSSAASSHTSSAAWATSH